MSPTVYFAQFNLNADAIAMVTASHNENGWTGVKMGIQKGLTHAPEEMKELKDITLNEKFTYGKGNEKEIKNFQEIYKDDLIVKNKINKKIKAVVACGNGTAGVFAPDILRGIGCDVIELDCKLDWSFPKYNPNPEDLKMLNEISKFVGRFLTGTAAEITPVSTISKHQYEVCNFILDLSESYDKLVRKKKAA